MINVRILILLTVLPLLAHAQETVPVNGVHDHRGGKHAFINANIYVSSSQAVDIATLLIADGAVVQTGKGISIPEEFVVHDVKGGFIYPSFIDLYAGLNVQKRKRGGDTKKALPTEIGNWNPAIHPEFSYHTSFPLEEKKESDWLASGFGLVNLHERDGIMRGSAEMVRLGVEAPLLSVVEDVSTNHFSFNKGTSLADYPSSHIGAVALIRQTFYDALWYSSSTEKKEVNPSLSALKNSEGAVNIFEVKNSLSLQNVEDLRNEFGTSFIIKGAGKEYLLDQDQLEGAKLILPLTFPKAFDVSDPYEAKTISLAEMKHWELAPYNPLVAFQKGAEVALTRDTIPSRDLFLKQLRRIHETGLSHDTILAMLTETPAEMIGKTGLLGVLSPGAEANFFISNKRFTEDEFQVMEHWTHGQRAYQKPIIDVDLLGEYNLVIGAEDFTLKLISVKGNTIKASGLKKGSDTPWKAEVQVERDLISIVLKQDSLERLFRLSGKLSLGGSVMDGKGQNEDGDWLNWAGIKDRKIKGEEKEAGQNNPDSAEHKHPAIWLPNMAYGRDSLPTQEDFVIANAMVWTCADIGLLRYADVWVEGGKIKAVGSGMLYPEGLKRIDAKGKHLTPGIIDEHSHIGVRGGVNEWAQASSAEVRIGDAIDPSNIQIYRHVASGVTAAQLLHGSANPVGGQSALIKMKWGEDAEGLLIKDAPGFIKFALGENVKRSNSKNPKNRFPLTRMGVEQTFIDAFTRAQEYGEQKASVALNGKKKKTQSATPSSRVDLELEALLEILQSERFISCHSYVQSEILMLMNVADSFGFKVNTFTHILEGYKVAEQMAEHGVSGSTFSDWWAYKFEVNDAIPYNAALMHFNGINTAINSDDAEMGRRLNQEAAKTIKYGGVSPEEALKMITINPAKALRLDDRIGSIEVGKDADLVLWSDNPLSVYSHAEKTFIEGVLYYDHAQKERLELRNEHARAEIIRKMMNAPKKETQPPSKTTNQLYHCDTVLEDYMNEE